MIRLFLALSLCLVFAGCASSKNQMMGGGGDVVGNGMMPEGYDATPPSACDCTKPAQDKSCGCEPKKKSRSH